jgi:hypothetical protein
MTKGGVNLSGIVTAARQGSRKQRGRSPVYDLMWDNYAELAPELNRPRRPNWQAVSKALGDQGVLDGAGQALTDASSETVRKTWWKVNRDKEAVAAGTMQRQRKAGQPIQGPNEAARPAQAAASTPAHAAPAVNKGMLPPAIEPPEEEPPKYKFEFASAKDWTKEPNKGDE